MMELDEAIRHAEEVAEQSEEDAKAWIREGWQSCFKNLTPEKEAEFFTERVKLSDGCVKCAEEHRQLAEWLKELKRVREQPWLKELKMLREQKRPRGEWIVRFGNTFITCNKCGYMKGTAGPYFRTHFEPLPNFCENCGAPMTEEAFRKYNGLKEGDKK